MSSERLTKMKVSSQTQFQNNFSGKSFLFIESIQEQKDNSKLTLAEQNYLTELRLRLQSFSAPVKA